MKMLRFFPRLPVISRFSSRIFLHPISANPTKGEIARLTAADIQCRYLRGIKEKAEIVPISTFPVSEEAENIFEKFNIEVKNYENNHVDTLERINNVYQQLVFMGNMKKLPTLQWQSPTNLNIISTVVKSISAVPIPFLSSRLQG